MGHPLYLKYVAMLWIRGCFLLLHCDLYQLENLFNHRVARQFLPLHPVVFVEVT